MGTPSTASSYSKWKKNPGDSVEGLGCNNLPIGAFEKSGKNLKFKS